MDEQLSVQSATGVDLTLNLAGPGNRSYAFVIDWHVRLLLAGAWLLIAAYALRLSLSARSHDALLSLLPAMVLYFLYHPIVEVAMRGRTPGKRMAGIRIVDRNGGTPGTGALLIRNLFRLIDSLPALYLIGLVCCIVTAHRVRIGDMAAGTLLVEDDAAAGDTLARLESLADSTLPLGTVELIDQILERWPTLGSENKRRIAGSLLARLQPGGDAAGLAAQSEADLHAQLLALLAAHGARGANGRG